MSQVLESPGRVDTASAMSGDVGFVSHGGFLVAAEIERCLASLEDRAEQPLGVAESPNLSDTKMDSC